MISTHKFKLHSHPFIFLWVVFTQFFHVLWRYPFKPFTIRQRYSIMLIDGYVKQMAKDGKKIKNGSVRFGPKGEAQYVIDLEPQ